MSKANLDHESFAARVWRKTLNGIGVKFSLTWIALLIFAAVFAPFLANSMPLVMSKNGVISAPVLRYLSVEDSWVLASFLLAVTVFRLKLRTGSRILLFLSGSLLAAVLVNVFVKPPVLVIYDDFRMPDYTQVDWRIMPPIP